MIEDGGLNCARINCSSVISKKLIGVLSPVKLKELYQGWVISKKSVGVLSPDTKNFIRAE